MPNPIKVTVGPMAAASANAIAQAQKPAAAGKLNLNGALVAGGIATLDVPRRVAIASDANDSVRQFTITGTVQRDSGQPSIPVTEVVTGVNGDSVNTTQDYSTVTSIAVDGATVGNITAGTSAKASSQWFVIDFARNPINIAFGFSISGAPSYTLEETYDDPNATPLSNVAMSPVPSIEPASNIPPIGWADANVTNKVAAFQYLLQTPFFAWRLVLNTADGASSVTAQAIQAGYCGA